MEPAKGASEDEGEAEFEESETPDEEFVNTTEDGHFELFYSCEI